MKGVGEQGKGLRGQDERGRGSKAKRLPGDQDFARPAVPRADDREPELTGGSRPANGGGREGRVGIGWRDVDHGRGQGEHRGRVAKAGKIWKGEKGKRK